MYVETSLTASKHDAASRKALERYILHKYDVCRSKPSSPVVDCDQTVRHLKRIRCNLSKTTLKLYYISTLNTNLAVNKPNIGHKSNQSVYDA